MWRPRWSRPGGAFQLINRGSERHCQQTELIHERTVKVPGAHGRSGCGSRFEYLPTAPSTPFSGGIIDGAVCVHGWNNPGLIQKILPY